MAMATKNVGPAAGEHPENAEGDRGQRAQESTATAAKKPSQEPDAEKNPYTQAEFDEAWTNLTKAEKDRITNHAVCTAVSPEDLNEQLKLGVAMHTVKSSQKKT